MLVRNRGYGPDFDPKFGAASKLQLELVGEAGVVLLQGPDLELVVGPVGHALGGGDAGGRGGETRDRVHVGCGADVIAVGTRTAAARTVDHEVDLAAGDEIDRVDARLLTA